MNRSTARLVLVLLLILDAYLFHEWFLGAFGGSDETAWIGAVAGAIAIALVGVVAFLLPRFVPLALARGVAIVACGALAATWLLGTAFSHFESGMPAGERVWMNLVAFGVFLIQLGVFVVAHVIERPGVGHTVASAAVGAVVVYLGGLVLVVVAKFGGQVADYAITAPRFEADSVMQESVARVQACALDHATRHPDRGYPADLRAIGPPPGTGCLDGALASGQKGRVRLTYEPGPRDAAGHVGDYKVVARAEAGQHGEAKLAYGDSAGFLRSGLAVSDPSKLPVVGGSLHLVRLIRACAEVYRQRHPTEGYPESAVGFAHLRDEVGERGAALVGCNPWLIPLRDSSRFVGGPFRLTYAVRPGAGDYVVELRPAVYAVHGIRSYRTTARGPVRMTREDRSATEGDAIVPPCEYDLGELTCAPLPGGLAPAAALDAAESARDGVPFHVLVQDLRAPAERDAPYQAAIECNSTTGREWESPPASNTYGFALAWDCTVPANHHAVWPDRALVRVWVRDRAGSVAMVTDTVRMDGVGAR